MMVQAHFQWQVWQERNSRIFEGKESEATKILRIAITRALGNVKSTCPKVMINNELVSNLLNTL